MSELPEERLPKDPSHELGRRLGTIVERRAVERRALERRLVDRRAQPRRSTDHWIAAGNPFDLWLSMPARLYQEWFRMVVRGMPPWH